MKWLALESFLFSVDWPGSPALWMRVMLSEARLMTQSSFWREALGWNSRSRGTFRLSLAVAITVSSKPAPNCSTYVCEERVSPSATVVGVIARKALVRRTARMRIDTRAGPLLVESMRLANKPSYFVPLSH